ncbi:MAG: DsrE/DsrF/DrsH-like family protein [Thiotrichales bacterium]
MNRSDATVPPETLPREQFNTWFREEHDRLKKEQEAAHTPSIAIVATKGTLDWAYPPFILGTTDAALGWNVSIFFSFYGLELLKRELDLKVSPLGNPAMPMKMPMGPEWFRKINWNIPNAVMGNVPGFESLTKSLFLTTLDNHGVASIKDLRDLAVEAEIRLIACQMTVDLFG